MARKYRGAQRIAPLRAEWARVRAAIDAATDYEAVWDVLWPDGDGYESYGGGGFKWRGHVLGTLEWAVRREGFPVLARQIKRYTDRIETKWLGFDKEKKGPNRRGNRLYGPRWSNGGPGRVRLEIGKTWLERIGYVSKSDTLGSRARRELDR